MSTPEVTSSAGSKAAWGYSRSKSSRGCGAGVWTFDADRVQSMNRYIERNL